MFKRHKEKPGDSSPQQMYAELRTQVLRLTPADLGDDAREAPVLALVMETGYPEGVATLVCVVDGSTNLYFSNGGGVIGAGERREVRERHAGGPRWERKPLKGSRVRTRIRRRRAKG